MSESQRNKRKSTFSSELVKKKRRTENEIYDELRESIIKICQNAKKKYVAANRIVDVDGLLKRVQKIEMLLFRKSLLVIIAFKIRTDYKTLSTKYGFESGLIPERSRPTPLYRMNQEARSSKKWQLERFRALEDIWTAQIELETKRIADSNNEEEAKAFLDTIGNLPIMDLDRNFEESANAAVNDLIEFASKHNLKIESDTLQISEEAMMKIASYGMAKECLICRQTRTIDIIKTLPCRADHCICIPCINASFGAYGKGRCPLCKYPCVWIHHKNEIIEDAEESFIENSQQSEEDTSSTEENVTRIDFIEQ
jgi:hypothetical protein